MSEVRCATSDVEPNLIYFTLPIIAKIAGASIAVFVSRMSYVLGIFVQSNKHGRDVVSTNHHHHDLLVGKTLRRLALLNLTKKPQIVHKQFMKAYQTRCEAIRLSGFRLFDFRCGIHPVW